MPKRARSYAPSSTNRRVKRARTGASSSRRLVPRPSVPRPIGSGEVRSRGPLPQSSVTTLRWLYNESLQSTSGANASTTVSLNGIYEPHPSSTRQPLGFDQMIAFYDRYVVTQARYRITFLSTSSFTDNTLAGTAGAAVVCYAIPHDVETDLSSSNTTAVLEQPGVNYRGIGPASGNGLQTLTGTVDIPNWLGRNAVAAANDSALAGSGAGNPSEEVFLRIGLGPIDNTSTTMTCKVLIDVEYTVTFMEPKVLAASNI